MLCEQLSTQPRNCHLGAFICAPLQKMSLSRFVGCLDRIIEGQRASQDLICCSLSVSSCIQHCLHCMWSREDWGRGFIHVDVWKPSWLWPVEWRAPTETVLLPMLCKEPQLNSLVPQTELDRNLPWFALGTLGKEGDNACISPRGRILVTLGNNKKLLSLP